MNVSVSPLHVYMGVEPKIGVVKGVWCLPPQNGPGLFHGKPKPYERSWHILGLPPTQDSSHHQDY